MLRVAHLLFVLGYLCCGHDLTGIIPPSFYLYLVCKTELFGFETVPTWYPPQMGMPWLLLLKWDLVICAVRNLSCSCIQKVQYESYGFIFLLPMLENLWYPLSIAVLRIQGRFSFICAV